MRFQSAKRAICAMVVLAGLTSYAHAGNWPSFRGPNGSGIGDGDPPIHWNVETGDHVRWKTAIPGLAHSSPIVWGDHVYITTAVSLENTSPEAKTGWLNGSGDSALDHGPWTWKLICLDKADGRVLWDRDAHSGVPRIRRHAKASHANCTPATDGEHVVAYFGSEGLHCYDSSGKRLWTQDLGLLKCGPYDDPELEWGCASSPIICDGQVIVQADALNASFWAAFDVRTGKELRRVKRKDITTWSTPAIADFGGQRQLVCNGFRQMAGYDLATGELLWHLRGGGDCPVPTPQVAGGLIYLTNSHGHSPIYAIQPSARGDLTPKDGDEKPPKGVAWWKPRGGSYMPTPLVLGSTLYVGNDNGILTAIDARTGEERFRERIEGGGTFSASLVAAGGQLYFASEAGDVFVLKVGEDYKSLATNVMGESCMATPAISDGSLFIRGARHLFCIGD